MNQSIYTERENILPHHAEWLDGCGATWEWTRHKFTKFTNVFDPYIVFREEGFCQTSGVKENHTHIPTGTEFCERVAEAMGKPKPTFGNPMQPFIDEITAEPSGNSEQLKGMAIEVSRLSEEDKRYIDSVLTHERDFGVYKYCIINGKDNIYITNFISTESEDLTITDSPTEFLQYVSQQTGKEYKAMNQDDKCMKCGNPIGNTVFTVCDNCWDVGKKSQDISSYPHKTYRILDSLDGIPLDTRFKLSEWIPPMNSRAEVIAIASQDLAYHGYYKHLQGDCITFHSFKLSGELILPLDGEWMRIV